MPTYEYECKSCGHRLEAVQSMTDAALTTCDECGGELRKVFHPAGIMFKGSGFYATDNRKGSKSGAETGSGSGTSSGTGAGEGKKSETTSEAKGSSSGDGKKDTAKTKAKPPAKADAGSSGGATKKD